MKSLVEFLAQKRETTIHTLTSYIKQVLREEWQALLQSQHEELVDTFNKAGEYAYGVYFRTLCAPLQEQLQQAGFTCEPRYPGEFRTSSVEYWGPPEERERCLWCVIKTVDGESLGTIVTQMFHDHTQFRLPHCPGVFALEETAPDKVIEMLSHASVRLQGRQQGEKIAQSQQELPQTGQPKWEYSVEIGLADNIDTRHVEITEAMLDSSLALWGSYGWELVNVLPHQQRLIAFFKRPARDKA